MRLYIPCLWHELNPATTCQCVWLNPPLISERDGGQLLQYLTPVNGVLLGTYSVGSLSVCKCDEAKSPWLLRHRVTHDDLKPADTLSALLGEQ